jgi:hypothetical protein
VPGSPLWVDAIGSRSRVDSAAARPPAGSGRDLDQRSLPPAPGRRRGAPPSHVPLPPPCRVRCGQRRIDGSAAWRASRPRRVRDDLTSLCDAKSSSTGARRVDRDIRDHIVEQPRPTARHPAPRSSRSISASAKASGGAVASARPIASSAPTPGSRAGPRTPAVALSAPAVSPSPVVTCGAQRSCPRANSPRLRGSDNGRSPWEFLSLVPAAPAQLCADTLTAPTCRSIGRTSTSANPVLPAGPRTGCAIREFRSRRDPG